MSFVSGAYLMAFNAKVCGQSQEGVVFDRTIYKRPITGDWMGQAVQDLIYLGMDLTSMVTLLEANAPALVDIIKPYNGSAAGYVGGIIGMLDNTHGVIKPLVLTSLLTAAVINANGGTGATSVLPLTRTLARTCLHENYPLRELLGNNLRDVPLKLRHLPSLHDSATGTGGGVYGAET